MTRLDGAQSKFWAENLRVFAKKYPGVIIQDDSITDEASFNNKYKTTFATGEVPKLFAQAGIDVPSQTMREF